MTDILLKTKAAAAQLGLSEYTLINWRCSGTGPPFVKLGRSVRYRKADLDEWVRDLPAHSSTAA